MGIFDRFKKKEVAPVVKKEPSLLERLCGSDKELYEELSVTIYLRPESIGTYHQKMEVAKGCEKAGALERAVAEYRNAGSLALYEGNATGVKKAFDKVAELSNRKFERLRADPDKAVEITKQYYSSRKA